MCVLHGRAVNENYENKLKPAGECLVDGTADITTEEIVSFLLSGCTESIPVFTARLIVSRTRVVCSLCKSTVDRLISLQKNIVQVTRTSRL